MGVGEGSVPPQLSAQLYIHDQVSRKGDIPSAMLHVN